MPKVSVYLPDELYREARERDLSISMLTQRALREAIDDHRNRAWIRRARERTGGPRTVDTARLLDEVRDEFGA